MRINSLMETETQILPPLFLDRLREIVSPDDFDGVAETFTKQKAACSFWLNPMVADPEETYKQLRADGIDAEPVPGIPNGCVAPWEQRSHVTDHALAGSGALYVQNLSSLLAVQVLKPRPREYVIDMCAAPGGKTLHIAAMMHKKGRVSAIEMVRLRYNKLVDNLKRGGADFVKTYMTDGRRVNRKTVDYFTRALVDAPCSSEARFHVDEPDSYAYWSEDKVMECAVKQRGLLISALDAIRPGGVCVYCTSSFSPEENESVIDQALIEFGDDVYVQDIEVPVATTRPGMTEWRGRKFDDQVAKAVRILPDDRFEGFFICRLRRKG